MKKIYYILLVVLGLIGTAVAVFTYLSPKDTVKAPVTTPVGGILVTAPKPGDKITSPLTIRGSVNGEGWVGFEGQVGTVRLFDSSNKELAIGILTATEDWMKLPVNFETTLFFDYPAEGPGKLVFHNENASGEPARDKTFTLPVTLQKSSSERTTLKVYFNNNEGGAVCTTEFYVKRDIPKIPAVAKAAIEELLKGPTDFEKYAGIATSINSGVKIQNLTIENGVAKVDFNEKLQEGVAGSCRVMAIRSQIEQTLKQFPTVKNVVISINGKTEDILQP